jgi:hypothetical protein
LVLVPVPTIWCQLEFGLQDPNLEQLVFTLQTGHIHNTGWYHYLALDNTFYTKHTHTYSIDLSLFTYLFLFTGYFRTLDFYLLAHPSHTKKIGIWKVSQNNYHFYLKMESIAFNLYILKLFHQELFEDTNN